MTMAKKIGQLDYDWDNPEPEPELSYSEKLAKQEEFWANLLPENLRWALRGYAYGRGHWAGEDEVNAIFVTLATEMVVALRKDGLIK
jgi:hypothetical protein